MAKVHLSLSNLSDHRFDANVYGFLKNGPLFLQQRVLVYLCSAGIKSKSRPNFSFHFQSPKDGNDVPFKVHEGPERLKTANSREHSFAELLEDFCGEKPKKSDIVSAEVKDLCFSGERSVTELLDGLKDRTGLLKRNSKMVAFRLISSFLPFTALFTLFNQVYNAVWQNYREKDTSCKEKYIPT